MYGSVGGIPLLIPDADPALVDLRDDPRPLPGHDCAALGIPPIHEALARGDRVLELGAGRETTTAPTVVRTDAFVFADGHLDVVADADALPFPDASFDLVFSLPVFEHLHSPWLAAAEIARVLRTRWRRRRLERALATAGHQFQQFGDRMLEAPEAYAAWRHIAPSVELLARRR